MIAIYPPYAFSVRASKVRASFMRATNPTTMPRNFKLFCSRDNCWIDRDPWEIQRKKRATKLGFRRSMLCALADRFKQTNARSYRNVQ